MKTVKATKITTSNINWETEIDAAIAVLNNKIDIHRNLIDDLRSAYIKAEKAPHVGGGDSIVEFLRNTPQSEKIENGITLVDYPMSFSTDLTLDNIKYNLISDLIEYVHGMEDYRDMLVEDRSTIINMANRN